MQESQDSELLRQYAREKSEKPSQRWWRGM